MLKQRIVINKLSGRFITVYRRVILRYNRGSSRSCARSRAALAIFVEQRVQIRSARCRSIISAANAAAIIGLLLLLLLLLYITRFVIIDGVTICIDFNTGFLFEFGAYIGRDVRLPRDEKQVGVCVLDSEPIFMQLLNNVFHATEMIVVCDTQDNFRHNKPAKMLVGMLPGS